MERRSCDTDGRHDGGFSRPRVAVLPRAVIQRPAARDMTTALSTRSRALPSSVSLPTGGTQEEAFRHRQIQIHGERSANAGLSAGK